MWVNFFVTWLKYLDFYQILCFAGPGLTKISNLSKTFNVTQISWFCPISWFCKTMLVKNLKFKQNFQHNSHFLILSNFMFRMTRVVKNLKFEQNFQRDSNFLILPNFVFYRTGVVKNLKFEQNFQGDSNFLILLILRLLQDQGDQKSQIWAKFSTRLKFLDFAKCTVPARPGWSKISDLSKISNVTQIS